MATRSISHLSATSGSAALHSVQTIWGAMCAMARARSTRRLLAEMDSRLLADIGASRGDAQMEAARPFWDTASRRR